MDPNKERVKIKAEEADLENLSNLYEAKLPTNTWTWDLSFLAHDSDNPPSEEEMDDFNTKNPITINLDKEIHDWLIENQIHCYFVFLSGNIYFDTEKDRTLFRLRWC